MNLGFYKLENAQRWKYLIFPALLIVGLILRLILSSYWTYEGDFGTWKAWAYGIYNTGFSKFYDQVWCDYMPGYLYVLWLLEYIHSAFPAMSDKILFKLPANLSDLGISILVFLVLRNITSLKNAQLTSLVYFFNPASLSNSTFWGQVDSVHTLPLLVSILFGAGGHFVLSSIFAAIAFMIKPQSVVIFPIIGFFAVRGFIRQGKEDRSVLKTLIFGFKILSAFYATIIAITLPFIWVELTNHSVIGIFSEPIFFIKDRFYTAYNQYILTSLNAFNFWGIFSMWQNDQIRFLGVTYQRWGTITFGFIYALVCGVLFYSEVRRSRAGAQNFECLLERNAFGSTANNQLTIRTFQALTLILFALFLFVTRAHERHFLPTIVFFTLIAFQSSLYWYFYALISAVYVVNMFYAYIELMPRVSGGTKTFIIKASSIQPFIPGLVFLLLIIFLIVLVDFIRNSVGLYRMKNS